MYLVTRYYPFGHIDQLLIDDKEEAAVKGGADHSVILTALYRIGLKRIVTHTIRKIGLDGIYDCTSGKYVKISGDLEYTADDTLYIVSAPDINKKRPGLTGVIKDKGLLSEIIATVRVMCNAKKLVINEVSYRGVYSVDENGENRKMVTAGLIGECVKRQDRVKVNP